MSFLSNWRPRHLVGAWSAYWLGLGVVTLGDAVAAIWRVTHAASGGASVALSYGEGLITLLTSLHDQPVWTGSVSPTTFALAVAGPPLLLWLAWLASRPSRSRDAEPATRPTPRAGDAALLDAPPVDHVDAAAARDRGAARVAHPSPRRDD
jgi:hypothetical protein